MRQAQRLAGKAVKRASDVKVRRHHFDLDRYLDHALAEGWFRHRAAALRHTLMDDKARWLRSLVHRADRRATKADLRARLEECDR